MKVSDLLKVLVDLPAEREPTPAFLLLKQFNTNFSMANGNLINANDLVEVNAESLIEESNYFNKKVSLQPILTRLNNIVQAPTGGVFI